MRLHANLVFAAGAISFFVAMGFMYAAAVKEEMKGTALGFRLIYRLANGIIGDGARTFVLVAMTLNIIGLTLLIIGIMLNGAHNQ